MSAYRFPRTVATAIAASGILGFIGGPMCVAEPTTIGLPAPTVPQGFGVNIHFTDPQPGEMERFREAGFGFARMDFKWSAIERTKGVYDFSAYDRLYDTLKGVGTRPLFILDYGNDLYPGGSPPTSSEARAAYAHFAVEAVRHFTGKGVIWEIWNEPNGDWFWHPHANADQYAAMALEAAKAMRAADPTATIIAPGSSGFPWPFLETVFKSGILRYIDGVSVHPYRGSMPETAATDYARLRVLIARYAPKGKENIPIISSEWGYSTAVGGVSENLQAAYLIRMWLSNLASGVNLSIFYDWRDDGDDPKENEYRFGTVHHDFTPKESFYWVEDLFSDLAGYTLRHSLPTSKKGDWDLLFQKGDDLIDVECNTTIRPDQELTVTKYRPAYRNESVGGYEDMIDTACTRYAPGPLASIAGAPVPLEITIHNPRPTTASVRVEVGALSQDVTLGGNQERTMRFFVAAPTLRSDAETTVPVRAIWNGRPAVALTPLHLFRTDPLVVSAIPRENGVHIDVKNPGDAPFTGSVVLTDARGNAVQRAALGLPLGTVSGAIDLSTPLRSFGIRLEDEKRRVVARMPISRFEPLANFPVASGATQFQQIRAVENIAQPQTPLSAVADGGKIALQFPYVFDKGWQYTMIHPVGHLEIPPGAKALVLWIKDDGSDNDLRCRFSDSTGQVFQSDLGKLNAKGWRPITIPLDGSGPGSHWGGGGNGIPKLPLAWECLLLVDSASKTAPRSGAIEVASPNYVFAEDRPAATP